MKVAFQVIQQQQSLLCSWYKSDIKRKKLWKQKGEHSHSEIAKANSLWVACPCGKVTRYQSCYNETNAQKKRTKKKYISCNK